MLNEIKVIKLNIDKQVTLISTKVETIYSALNELKRTSDLLLKLTQNDKKEIHKWLKQKEFLEQKDSFFISNKDLENFDRNILSSESITYHWNSKNKDDDEICFNMYALREIGETIKQIKEKLGGVTIIYYQDIIKNTAIAYPYFKMNEVIPADFIWKDYFASQSVNPINNKNKEIKWSMPNIDYAGEGLISIASIPIYKDDLYSGLWSIDIPHSVLYDSIQLDTYLMNQKNFITDYEGNIIVHPTVQTTINKEEGSFVQVKLSDMEKNYKKIDLSNLIKKQRGEIEISYNNNVEYLIYQIIPKLNWILFISFQKDEILIELEKQNIELELKLKEQLIELQEKNKLLEELSITDNLTKLYNRNKIDEVLIYESNRTNRTSKPFGVILLDIDYFKKVNDTYGHQTGDIVLQEFAEILRTHLRKTDTIGRWGGEEFLIICNEIDLDGILTLAEKLREEIEFNPFSLGEQKTASFGVSIYKNGEDIQGLIKRADDALYKAKENGRNRVEYL